MARFFFGRVKFSESEEYLAFRFRFLCIVMLSGALFTLVFVVCGHAGLLPQFGQHLQSMTAFTVVAFALWLLLRGHKRRFLTIAWTYEVLCMLEYVSALIYVGSDELRILWFYVNVPGVYILLGQRAGLGVTLLTLAGLLFGNAYLAAPYSPDAMATALLSLIYLGLFFHLYGDRSLSYFVRMRESNRQLSYLASHDPLTGLLNARAYYAACDRLIALAARTGTPCSVLFVDLDHFKAINDRYGHAAGDTVLRTIAVTLSAGLRKSDVLGRIGGEEFSVFLPNTDLTGARVLAENMRIAIEAAQPLIDAMPLKVTASIGVSASLGGDARSMLEIQRQADQAMYRAKAAGRNRVSCLEDSIA